MIDFLMDERDSKPVLDRDNVIYILAKYLQNEKLYLQGNVKKTPVKVEILPDKNLKVFLPFDYQFDEYVTLYGFFKKYIAFEIKYNQTMGIGKHLFEPVRAVIATSGRQEPRYKVSGDSVVARNFKILPDEKEIINVTTKPVQIFAIFQEYQSRLKEFYPNVEAKPFTEKDEIVDLVYKSRKVIYLEDTQDEKSYFHDDNEEIIDLGSHLGNNIRRQVQIFDDEKIKSLLIYPVIYHRYQKRDIPFSYFKIWSEKEPLEIESIMMHLNFTAYEMLNKIKQSLMTDLEIEQPILDVSKSGLRLLVKSQELKDYLLSNDEFRMDIQYNIPGQNCEPITIHGNMAHKSNDENNDMHVGISIASSEKNGFELQEKYIDLLQKKGV
ncbi:MAG: DUF1577 domain-containing protein [Spirochaetota bacterium]|nr:DUF1577 domain-containing protein [Spirochaetota bacterium]